MCPNKYSKLVISSRPIFGMQMLIFESKYRNNSEIFSMCHNSDTMRHTKIVYPGAHLWPPPSQFPKFQLLNSNGLPGHRLRKIILKATVLGLRLLQVVGTVKISPCASATAIGGTNTCGRCILWCLQGDGRSHRG